MRQVQTEDVDAGANELFDVRGLTRRRAEGGDDLGTASVKQDSLAKAGHGMLTPWLRTGAAAIEREDGPLPGEEVAQLTEKGQAGQDTGARRPAAVLRAAAQKGLTTEAQRHRGRTQKGKGRAPAPARAGAP